METHRILGAMADLLEYPGGNYHEKVERCCHLLGERQNGFHRFAEFVALARQDALEEIYVQTFDVQGICCLDVGYVMFGEDYRRGQFMAQVKMLENKCGLGTGAELPDFLPHMLRLLARLRRKDAEELVANIMAPAVDKMLAGFRENGNIFREPLTAVRDLLREEYGA